MRTSIHAATVIRCLATSLVIAVVTGCAPKPSGMSERDPDAAAPHEQSAAKKDGEAVALAPAKSSAERSTHEDLIAGSFSGQALVAMRGSSVPASPVVAKTVNELAISNARLEVCRGTPTRQEAYQVDIDDDGLDEVLALYSMADCGGSNNEVRVLTVMRATDRGAWAPVTQAVISVKPGESRTIEAIGSGQVTLAPSDTESGEVQPPEIIDVPALP